MVKITQVLNSSKAPPNPVADESPQKVVSSPLKEKTKSFDQKEEGKEPKPLASSPKQEINQLISKMTMLATQVDQLTKKVAELEKTNLKFKGPDIADLDKQVIDNIKKKAPEIMKDLIQKELAEFVKLTKLNVQDMKNEQVNQIKSGVI